MENKNEKKKRTIKSRVGSVTDLEHGGFENWCMIWALIIYVEEIASTLQNWSTIIRKVVEIVNI